MNKSCLTCEHSYIKDFTDLICSIEGLRDLKDVKKSKNCKNYKGRGMNNKENQRLKRSIDTMLGLIYHDCIIKPLEDLEGKIISVFITKRGVEYQVRYYMDGEQKDVYFLSSEIEIK